MSAPVIFDIAYTPYKLKKGSSEKDIEKHAKERAFFDMSGAENIYNYMTREGKIYGEESKRLTILEYLQKSTGVFNQNGMLSKDEVADMKFRVKNGEKNIWHGFISFDEQNSEKIDSHDRCIALIKQTFRPFFKDAGFDHDNTARRYPRMKKVSCLQKRRVLPISLCSLSDFTRGCAPTNIRRR